MKEWKIHDMENDRKYAPWKMIEKSHPKNDRVENDRKITHWKMTEKAHAQNEKMGNA